MTAEREREERLAELETCFEEIASPAHRASAPLALSGAADTVARNIHPGGSLEGLRCR